MLDFPVISTSRNAPSKKRGFSDTTEAGVSKSKRAKQITLDNFEDRQRPSGSKPKGRNTLGDVTKRRANPPMKGLPTPLGSVKRKNVREVIIIDDSSSPVRPSHGDSPYLKSVREDSKTPITYAEPIILIETS